MTHPDRPARVPTDTSFRTGADQAYSILAYLMAGLLVYGGLGWLGDHFLHTRFLLPIGIVLGMGLSLYVIVKRFGRTAGTPDKFDAEGTPSHREES